MALELRADGEELPVLLRGAEAEHELDAGPVVPAPIEDHDLPGRGEVLEIALDVHLALLPFRGRGQCDDANDAWADTLSDRLDDAALAGRIAAFEDDDDALARMPHPVL
jgi:hypothetical protein